jgi:alkyl sulfatase BDS1-like metallo-beta-lactamase superfamily hydrolase
MGCVIINSIIRVNNSNQEAKKLKVHAMKQWRYLQSNIYFRNLSLSGCSRIDWING